MFDRALYQRASEDLRKNKGQWDAYNSTGHCVVLAGPGSGKTKTLTIKLARVLAEDIEEPRGVACITYNNECVKELEHRLDTLGVESGPRVFIGTVHSFALTQIILPYAKTADLGLPKDFRVATRNDQKHALERAYNRVINRGENPQDWELAMSRHRRSILNWNSVAWRTEDPELSKLVEAYEADLRKRGMIDFDDMPLLAVRALAQHQWIQRSILAKYPVLAVDEYQDLGRALHAMVMGLCFSTGIRLFAVGDADQSIYGFTGAYPELLQRLSERTDVQTVRLRLNYRCGSRIVAASQYALGEERDYEAPDTAHDGTIFFHPLTGDYEQQADYLFSTILPEAQERMPGITLGNIAVLYPAAWIGDKVANAAQEHGFEVVRSDTNALYSRSSALLRWLESCAAWCCEGWRTGDPRFSRLIAEGNRIFAEELVDNERKVAFRRILLRLLWGSRDEANSLHTWLQRLHDELVGELIKACRTLDDDRLVFLGVIDKTKPENDAEGLTLGRFSGCGDGNDRINLSTLHSSKGREFALVVLFGMDNGRIPRPGGSMVEARRLFYVGFTRAERELHLMFSRIKPSPFVVEVQSRVEEDF